MMENNSNAQKRIKNPLKHVRWSFLCHKKLHISCLTSEYVSDTIFNSSNTAFIQNRKLIFFRI